MRPTVPEILPLVWDLYDRSPVGCCLHIVLDDGNVKDDHVRFCIEQAKEQKCESCLRLAEILLQMSKTQRKVLGSRAFEREHKRLNGTNLDSL